MQLALIKLMIQKKKQSVKERNETWCGAVWCSFQNAVMKDFFMLLLRHHNEKNSWLQFTSALFYTGEKLLNTYRRNWENMWSTEQVSHTNLHFVKNNDTEIEGAFFLFFFEKRRVIQPA